VTHGYFPVATSRDLLKTGGSVHMGEEGLSGAHSSVASQGCKLPLKVVARRSVRTGRGGRRLPERPRGPLDHKTQPRGSTHRIAPTRYGEAAARERLVGARTAPPPKRAVVCNPRPPHAADRRGQLGEIRAGHQGRISGPGRNDTRGGGPSRSTPGSGPDRAPGLRTCGMRSGNLRPRWASRSDKNNNILRETGRRVLSGR